MVISDWIFVETCHGASQNQYDISCLKFQFGKSKIAILRIFAPKKTIFCQKMQYSAINY